MYRYSLTLCTWRRFPLFTDAGLVTRCRWQLQQSAAASSVAILAYCFMPDHLHFLVEGSATEADLRRFVSGFKQRTGYEHKTGAAARLWQAGYYDRVLRKDEESNRVAQYIFANPVRAGLVVSAEDYPFSGSFTTKTAALGGGSRG
jgi:putative transposase